LKNLVASTREQNRYLGQEGFSNRRVKLIKEFKAAPKNARGPIIEKLNTLSEEFVPGRLRYDVRKDGSLKITNLQPETTLKAKSKAYGEITKTFPKNIQKLLISLCPKGKASGGRIGFQTAGSAVSTLECGRRAFTKLANSKNKTPQQISAIKEILRMGSGLMKGVGTMLNPAEFFKLKNLVGPGAWAAMGAFEVGAITYDTINRNTPLNEALSNNWVTGWAMPWTKKEAQIKNLGEENISGSPAMQKYMEHVKLMAKYEREEKVLTGLKTRYGDQERAKVLYENQQATLDKINNDWVNLQETAMVERDGEMVPVTGGELEFQKAVSDMEGNRKAGYHEPDISEGIPRDLNEFGYRDVGDAPWIAKKLFGKAALQGHDPMFETTGIQPIFDLPPSSPLKGYHEIKRPLNLKGATTTPLDADTLQMYAENLRNIGFLEPRGELPQWYIDMVQKNEKWRQLFEQSPTGLHGTALAGGGIAGIRKPSEIPPERQGLRSIMINGKKY
jgi:hypothetical protein